MRNGLRKLVVWPSRWLHHEEGFALATTLFMVLAAFATVSVGVMATIQTQTGTVQDQDTKSALTAAETGLDQAMFRYNAYTRQSDSQSCVVPSGTALASASPQTSGPEAGWCEAVPGTDASGGFSYQVCPTWSTTQRTCVPNGSTGTMAIVATGSVNGVTRRVEQTVTRAAGQNVFANAQVQAQDSIGLRSNANIYASAATNGDITLDAGSKLCGVSTVGPGHHITLGPGSQYWSQSSANTCTGSRLDPSTAGQQTVTLPPINQGSSPTVNDDYRITNALSNANPRPTPADLVSGNKNGVQWSASARTLTLNSNSTLTLTGKTYSFCKLTLNASANLYIHPSEEVPQVNIFFDSCGQSEPLTLNSAGRLTTSTGVATTVGLYFVGTSPTTFTVNSASSLNEGCVNNFVIYAPYTDVTFNSNSSYCGALAAHKITLNSSSQITRVSNPGSFSLPNTLPHYSRSQYVECAAQPAAVPNSGC